MDCLPKRDDFTLSEELLGVKLGPPIDLHLLGDFLAIRPCRADIGLSVELKLDVPELAVATLHNAHARLQIVSEARDGQHELDLGQQPLARPAITRDLQPI